MFMDLAHVGDLVFRQIDGLGLRRRFIMESVRYCWPEIVGSDVARVTYAYAVDKDVLRVRVVDSCWRQELRLRKGEIIRLIEERFGKGVLKDIVFSVGRVGRRLVEKREAADYGRELTVAERQWVDEVVRLVKDSRLEGVLRDTLVSYLLSRKGR